MEPNDIIAYYQAVADRCRAMLDYASEGDWDKLIATQGEYVGAVEHLAVIESGVALDAPMRQCKYDLLIEIRDLENAVRDLLDARMDELSAAMTATRNQRRVRQAYDRGIIS